ncbi:hypothetical protein WCU37_15320 [Serratia marcescens]|uniref:hypothetical protein n=1 Tax=Serratia TaxID=613 RepID=UPI000D72E60D|nr:hypothetical protein [Serratia marcescens]AWQ48547.1 hypothetical protein B1A42_14890 [Serratia marcescens]ELY1862141.1 hypothetical protein [Serratia marcescens]MCA4110433.1 hypothetical protein [Serratia marcescens]
MLDFSYLSDTDGSKPSVILNDKKVQLIESSLLYLKGKTGVYVDPYGKTRIYPDHQKILISHLLDNKDEDIKKLVSLFIEAVSLDEVIIADGD